jgi:hypothetical protein
MSWIKFHLEHDLVWLNVDGHMLQVQLLINMSWCFESVYWIEEALDRLESGKGWSATPIGDSGSRSATK